MYGRIFAVAVIAASVCAAFARPTVDLNAIAPGVWTEGRTLFRDKKVYVHESKMHTVVVDSDERPAPLHPLELIPRLEQSKKDRSAYVSGVGASPIPDKFFHFVPEYVGALHADQSLSWSAPCFRNSSVTVQMAADGTASLAFNVESGSSLLCGDNYVIMTVTSWHLATFELHGEHKVTWKQLSALELDDVTRNGFRIFRFDDSMTTTVADVYETASLFLGALDGLHGSHVPDDVAAKNIKFLKEYSDFDLPNRTVIDLPISESDIHSGDVFGILRLDGLDPLICWGTGGRLGHTAVALRIDGELYVLESQTKSNYWPKDLIQRNKFSDWIANAINADYNVVLLPLSQENRAKFNETAAAEWFLHGVGGEPIEGLMYGFRGFIFGWIDTLQANYPPPLDESFVMTGFALMDPLMDVITSKAHVPSLWNEALNKRIGTVNLTTAEVYEEAAKRNLTFGDLMTQTEKDSFIYSGSPYWREGPSMVCNVFVCNIYRAAGLFDGVADFDCAETVPLDLYEMQLFQDAATAYPDCAAKEPGSQLCQILGKNVLTLPHFNTVKPFNGMRTRCPGTPPAYADRFSAAIDDSC